MAREKMGGSHCGIFCYFVCRKSSRGMRIQSKARRNDANCLGGRLTENIPSWGNFFLIFLFVYSKNSNHNIWIHAFGISK